MKLNDSRRSSHMMLPFQYSKHDMAVANLSNVTIVTRTQLALHELHVTSLKFP